MAEDKAEFERYRNGLNGKLESVLDGEKVTTVLGQAGVGVLDKEPRLILLHERCDIRQQYAAAMENIGQVRAWDGKLVPGYQTFNTVAVTTEGKRLRWLDWTVYSNGAEHFVSQAELTAWEKGKLARSEAASERQCAQEIAP